MSCWEITTKKKIWDSEVSHSGNDDPSLASYPFWRPFGMSSSRGARNGRPLGTALTGLIQNMWPDEALGMIYF